MIRHSWYLARNHEVTCLSIGLYLVEWRVHTSQQENLKYLFKKLSRTYLMLIELIVMWNMMLTQYCWSNKAEIKDSKKLKRLEFLLDILWAVWWCCVFKFLYYHHVMVSKHFLLILIWKLIRFKIKADHKSNCMLIKL